MSAVVAGTAARAKAGHLRVAVGYSGGLAAGAGWTALFVVVLLLFLAAFVAWILAPGAGDWIDVLSNVRGAVRVARV